MCRSELCKMISSWIFLVFTLAAQVMGEISKCEKLSALAAWKDHNTIVETSYKTLAGSWISEGCETRPGPEYVLRSYTFSADGRYNLIQHHYWDDSCSSPKLTILSIGRIHLRNALVQPGASNGILKPNNISIIPQDLRAARELDNLVVKECPDRVWKSWQPNEEHLIFNNKFERRPTVNLWSQGFISFTSNHVNSNPTSMETSGEIRCLDSLKWSFNELKLLKVQLRPLVHSHHKHIITQREMELLVGDIHSSVKRREFYSPTSFQVPLLKQTRGENITMEGQTYSIKSSNLISMNLLFNLKNPPHLIEKPHLPPYIWGQWTSTRCEARPLDVYLIRRFTFHEEDFRWIGEHKFYSDPFCTYPKFIVTASGRFVLSGENENMKGTTNINFQIEKATMVAMEKEVITDMRLPGFCGLGEWRVNVPKDLTRTNGCISLGIFIPSVRFDIIKIDIDYKGSWVLFLGQEDSNNLPSTEVERPTSFQLPLVKCGDSAYSKQSISDYINRRLSLNTGSSIKANGRVCLGIFLMIYIFIR